jgi:hypothetical protein
MRFIVVAYTSYIEKSSSYFDISISADRFHAAYHLPVVTPALHTDTTGAGPLE